MQDNITIETENVSWLEMEVFYNMLGSRNNNHDSEFDNTIIDTAILNSNTWCSSGLASYISSFVFTCQLLMNVLIYNHKDEKKCP